jgi:predicted house-cleaning noncanonical NTP pyrophosphatase (MazG superfamily)
VKLVRDNIPKIIEDTGKSCRYHIAGYNEYETRLYDKMREELDEFIEAPSYEEAADMWEVFLSICELHEIKMRRLKLAMENKRKERGGFKDRIILESVNESR